MLFVFDFPGKNGATPVTESFQERFLCHYLLTTFVFCNTNDYIGKLLLPFNFVSPNEWLKQNVHSDAQLLDIIYLN